MPVMRQSPTAGVTTCRRPLRALRFPALIAARISKARACAAARANASAPIVSARQTWLSWPRSESRQTPSVAASAVVPLSQLGAMAAEYRNLSAFALTNVENGSQGLRPDFVRANAQEVPVLWGYFGRPMMTSRRANERPHLAKRSLSRRAGGGGEGRCPSAASTPSIRVGGGTSRITAEQRRKLENVETKNQCQVNGDG